MLNSRKEILPYVPHSGTMLLLDRVLEHSDDHVVAELEITPSIPFYMNGAVPAYVCIEVMAQCIAAWFGLRRNKPNDPPPIGFLIGVRQFKSALQSFANLSLLKIYADRVMTAGEFAKFNCQMDYKNADGVQPSAAAADISVYLQDEQNQVTG